MATGRVDLCRVGVYFRAVRAIRRHLIPLFSLVSAGCGGFVGTDGEPCNERGLCLPGLACVAGTCQPQLGSGSGPDMVEVPAGPFIVGCNTAVGEDCVGGERELPAGMVTLSGFFIDRTEVTAGAYAACVSAGACRSPSCESPSPQYPVVCISWADARDFCGWRGARLPTEREWEKAARGIDGRIWPTGNTVPTCAQANILGCDGPWPAGSQPGAASPYGALDMAGNVWEWTEDWYDAAAQQYRVSRGGDWDDVARDARASYRRRLDPTDGSVDLGLRCAQSF